jgi:hypothetical protein
MNAKVMGEHLSLVKQACHDDATRIVAEEHEEIPGLPDRWLGRVVGARLDVIGEVPIADIADWPHAWTTGIVPKVHQGLIDQAPISVASLHRFRFFPTNCVFQCSRSLIQVRFAHYSTVSRNGACAKSRDGSSGSVDATFKCQGVAGAIRFRVRTPPRGLASGVRRNSCRQSVGQRAYRERQTHTE